MRAPAIALAALAIPALAAGPVVWRSGRTDNAPNFVSLQHLVTFGGVSSPDQAVILDWGEIRPDTPVSAVTFQACTEYPPGPNEGLDAVIRLYDRDNGYNTATRIEAGSLTAHSLEGDDSPVLCLNIINYTVAFDTPVELGDTDGVPAVPGAVFNPFGFEDIDGDGTHDFSYSIRFDLPAGDEEYVFVTGVPAARPAGGDRFTDIFDGDVYVGPTDVFRNLFMLLHGPGCNAADFAEPYGTLDADDIAAFVGAFLAGDLLADQAPPLFKLDLADLTGFVESYLAGCP